LRWQLRQAAEKRENQRLENHPLFWSQVFRRLEQLWFLNHWFRRLSTTWGSCQHNTVLLKFDELPYPSVTASDSSCTVQS